MVSDLWVEVCGPRGVSIVTRGTVQALRMMFHGLWVVELGPSIGWSPAPRAPVPHEGLLYSIPQNPLRI